MASTLWAMAIISQAQQPGVVKEILIRGNVRVSKEAIYAAIRTKVGLPFSQDTLDKDKKSLQELGFFEAVDTRATPIEGSDWRISVNLVEYPEVKEIRVVGNSVVKTDDIRTAIKPFMKSGDVFNLNSLRPASDAIRSLYSRKGFVSNIVEFSPLKDSPNTVNIVIEEVRVGKVTSQGARTTKDWVFRRLIKTRVGDPFSVTKWTNDLRRLQNTQWFEKVQWIDDPNQDDPNKINLIADLKETKTGTFNVGVQLDPSSSLAGIIKLSDINFRGTGQSVSFNYTQATQGSGPSVEFDYSNPFIDNKDTSIHAALYSRLNFRFSNVFSSGSPSGSSNQYNERRTGGSLGLTRPISDQVSFGINARYEGVKTSNVNTTLSDQFIQQDGTLAVVTLGVVRNRRDRDLDATHGDWIKLDTEPAIAHITEVGGAAAAQDVLGNHSYYKNTVEYRTYFTDQGPIGRNFDATRRVLALRFRAGTITGIVPYFEQFFAGGADTLRGYAEDRFWGRNELLSTAELRLPIQKAFSVIGFIDYGGAWGGYGNVNDFTQTPKIQLHMGYGAGVSFKTPLGPIRVDLGFDDKGKSRTHFLIGTSF
jgi:outer membrane protein insertion porin family